MSKPEYNYTGAFASHLESFINEKKALGCRYTEEGRLAHEFDKLSMKYDCSGGLSAELVNEFTKYKPNWQATTQKRHISFLKNFGRYLQNHDIESFLPGQAALKTKHASFKPYIFSHTEIEEIFRIADRIRPNCRNSHIFYPVIFRTLYGTGARISEALNLTMKNVDLQKKTILVVDPKNHQDRCLPISDSLSEYLIWYQSKIHPTFHEDDLFFESNRGNGHYYRNNVQVFFSRIITDMSLPYGGFKSGGPHLHCLRHTACVHSLEQLLKDGMSHGVALQLLSVFMGHRSLSATARYLQLTAEAFPDLTTRLEEMYRDVFPQIEVAKEIRMPYEEDH